MSASNATRVQHTLLRAWHAWLAGSFLVAYVAADEDTYAIHQFAGYAVLAAILARLTAGLLAPAGSPLRLPHPTLQAARTWLSERRGRHPLFAWLAAALLAVVGLTAATGAIADIVGRLEHPHEAIAEASVWLIIVHIAFVAYMYAGKRWLARMAAKGTIR
ncbi:MAG: hypothetical protein ACOY4R_28480 [Pseudomonadota bacterium]